MRQANPMSTIDLPERVYCADVLYPCAVVGVAGRQIQVYSLDKGPAIASQIESPLTFQVSISFVRCAMLLW